MIIVDLISFPDHRMHFAICGLGTRLDQATRSLYAAAMCSLIVGVLALLFAFTDAWYFVRFFFLFLKVTLKRTLGRGECSMSKEDLLNREYRCNGVVLPSDLDCMLHMNNSRYLREMDFGRVGLGLEWGIRDVVKKLGGRAVLNATAVRYRRSLTLFQRFVVKTRILCWDEGAIYFEHKVVSSDGFVCTVVFAKLAVRGVTAPVIFQTLVGCGRSPPPPPEVQSWMESIVRSSEAMKSEGNVEQNYQNAKLE